MRLGFQFDYSVTIGGGWYTGYGSVETDATLDSFSGMGFDINADIGAEIGFWGSLGENSQVTWFGIGYSVGYSIGISMGITDTKSLRQLLKY